MRRVAFMLAGALLAGPAVADDPDAIVGLWYTDQDEAQVRIERSAADGYTGTLVQLKEPDYPPDDAGGMAGKPKVDRENPDPARRTQPVLGLRIMHGFRYAGDGEWQDGSIYDPKNGKTYRCKVKLAADGRLKVRGYIGISLIGRTTTWRRAPAP